MAKLRHTATGRVRLVPRYAVFGRTRSCHFRLDHRRVSKSHAEIEFGDEGWQLKDLQSRNGTWLDGERLTGPEPKPLALNSILQFGAPEESWQLVEDSPTGIFISSGEREIEVRDSILALPAAEELVVTIYSDREGVWVAEFDDGPRPLENDGTIDVRGTSWCVHLPEELSPTEGPQATSAGAQTSPPDIRDCKLILAYRCNSPDRAPGLSVIARVIDERTGVVCDLGERVHHNFLLELARVRKRHMQRGLEPGEQGWATRTQLADWLEMVDVNKLNVHIFRLREQIQKAGFKHAADIVEPWKGEKKIRLGLANFEIHNLNRGK